MRTYSKTLLFVVAGAFAFTVGCGGEKKASTEAQQAAPAAAPASAPAPAPQGQPAESISQVAHSAIKTQKEVRLTDAVKAKWKEVKLEVTDVASKKSEVVTVKVGSSAQIGKDGSKIEVESFVPDYSIVENRIESRSNEAKNPAALLKLTEKDAVVARGWVFRDFPDFNSFGSAKYAVKLVGPGAGKK